MNVCHDGKGNNYCWSCGHKWQTRGVYYWWPWRIKLHRRWNWGKHGYQVGHLLPGERVMMRVISLGFVRLLIGPKKFTSPIIREDDKWIHRDIIKKDLRPFYDHFEKIR